MPHVLKGIIACQGIVKGKIFVLEVPEIKVNMNLISPDDVDSELAKFRKARMDAREQISKIQEAGKEFLTSKELAIFDGHIEILTDEGVDDEVVAMISNMHYSADRAVDEIRKNYMSMFESMSDAYMRERAADVNDVFRRVIAIMKNQRLPMISDITEPVIVLAKDLTPSDTAQMNPKLLLGFITEEGGATSHVSIMARTLGISAIVGVPDVINILSNEQEIILNANTGEVIFNYTAEEEFAYDAEIAKYESTKDALNHLIALPAETTDNHKISIMSNIGTPKDASRALELGAEGIGLFRTEFLFMDRPKFPTEEEQFLSYKEVAESFGDNLVVIRTMDIGGDKSLPYFEFPHELNPFLGWRALRVSLDHPDIFKVQLRAILRASAFGRIGIMYPMVISVAEVERANAILEICKEELISEGKEFDGNIEVGIMIETPAAALLSDKLAKITDFFSVGTNDLTQYTLAVDRGGQNVANLYNSFHPAVLELIRIATKAAHKYGKWIGICGELGGDPRAAIFFTGIGIDELSMSAGNMLKVKQVIRSISLSDAKSISKTILNMESGEEIEKYLQEKVDFLLK